MARKTFVSVQLGESNLPHPAPAQLMGCFVRGMATAAAICTIFYSIALLGLGLGVSS